MSAAADTIVAIATPSGRGAIGIVRISGADARKVASAVAGALPSPRRAVLRSFRNGQGAQIDRGLLIHFPAPNSFTGEDLVELQAHGSPIVLAELVETLCAAGARLARPGEFSERAFLNGRIDLAQAEAIADLIDAGSRAATRAATRTLEGSFSQRIQALLETLTSLRVQLEAELDFADEDLPAAAPEQLRERLAMLVRDLADIQRLAAQGRRLREGLRVAIVGRPNVGKSTLLNRLAGVEAAIVSPQAGTTRDLLCEHIMLDGLPLIVVDTAGLREAEDAVEREGVRRARREAASAELVLFVIDDCCGWSSEDQAQWQALAAEAALIVRNKCDLSGAPPGRVDDSRGHPGVRISAADGAGFESLARLLRGAAGLSEDSGQAYSARARHLEALRAAQENVQTASQLAHVRADAVLIAEELRLAQRALEAITGRFTTEDLLAQIFSSFCLGK